MKWNLGWKRITLSIITAASIGLSLGLPARAVENAENERVEAIWHEVQELTQLKQALRNYGQPDPYGWFRMPSISRVRYAVADEREAEIFGQALPLDMQQMFAPPGVSPDDPSLTKPTPQVGEVGITETVAEIMARENSGPPPVRHEPHEPVYPSFEGMPTFPLSPPISQYPPPQKGAGRQVLSLGNGSSHPYVWQPWQAGNSWLGAGVSDTPGYYPPDSIGAAGPTQVVVAVNGRIRVFDKNGVLGGLNVSPETFFSSVGGAGGVSDPRVRFDKTSNRWFILAINVTTPNRVLIAVSSGPTITNSSSFTFFFFALSGSTFLDYPTLGVDKNALYIGGNMFSPNFSGCNGYVVRKSSVLGAGPIVVTTFANISASNGLYTPQGGHNDDPNATEGYFFGHSIAFYGQVVMRRVSTPGGTPTISSNITLTVPATQSPSAIPSQGSSFGLDGLDFRIFDAQIHTNRLTGVSSLWAAHSFRVDTSGAALNSGTRNGSRWYQFTNLTGTPSLVQSGTVFDSAASNPSNYWIPSIMMNGQGHAILGSSTTSPVKRAEIAIAARLSSDTLGTTQTPVVVQTSTFAYNPSVTNPDRWGDYSTTVIDPTDDMSFWTFQEYCNATNSWGVRVVKLLAPAPAAIASISPNTLTQGATANIVVTGTSSNGTGFFDPNITGYPDPSIFKRLAAAFSGAGLTVNSVTFTNPTSFTLNVTAGAAAATGTRNLTVTNPDGQAVTANNILTVTASTGTVSGTITLQSIVNSVVPITFEFRPQPSGATFTRTPTLDAVGHYSLTLIPTGTYNVGVKGARWLRTTVNNVIVTNGTLTLNAALRAGDSNNDNVADINDLLSLIAHYNQTSPAVGYLDTVDFNNDGTDDISDLLILIANYNQAGDA